MILAWAAAQAVFGIARDFKGLWNRLGEYYKAEGRTTRRPCHAVSLFQRRKERFFSCVFAPFLGLGGQVVGGDASLSPLEHRSHHLQ